MGAGAEGAAGVDHDRERVRPAAVSHGGPDPERADRDRLVELAPALLPAVLDLRDAPRPGRLASTRVGRLSVGGELDGVGALALLEPLGRELDEAGSELLGLSARRRDGGPDQRKALFSLSKNPWSGR